MTQRRLLLLSNSKNYGQQYLAHAGQEIKDFLGRGVGEVIFIPFAAVRFTYDDYAEVVRARFGEMGYELRSAHDLADPERAVSRAEAIIVGGGNTFHLLRGLQNTRLLEAIRERVGSGAPYIGWSAGSNVACPTIKTTNDMPIVEPENFRALSLVPFQINPHYLDTHPEGHQGETREERLLEFIEANPGVPVVGLREGSLLRVEQSSIRLVGSKTARIFIKGEPAREYAPADSLDFLLDQ